MLTAIHFVRARSHLTHILTHNRIAPSGQVRIFQNTMPTKSEKTALRGALYMKRTGLITDADFVFVSELSQVLEESGTFRVIEIAPKGKLAVRVAEERYPDVFVMDILMPEFDALEQKGKTNDIFFNMPINGGWHCVPIYFLHSLCYHICEYLSLMEFSFIVFHMGRNTNELRCHHNRCRSWRHLCGL